jgi:hypothetical protein
MERSKETTMKNQIRSAFFNMLVFVLGIACTQAASAQTFRRVIVGGGVKLAQVAAGGASVWARSTTGKPYIFKTNKFVKANSISLTQIAVGGGSAVQPDTVWGLDSSNNVYTAVKSGSTWLFVRAPGVLDFIAVGPGYQDNCHFYEVWGLNPAAEIYRYNYCLQNWEQVQGTLGTLAVGGGDIWGLNGNGQVFRFDFRTSVFNSMPGPLSQIAVGPNDAWGLSSNSKIYQFFDDVQNFLQLSGVLTQIGAGGNGVWGLNSSGEIFRLEPSRSSFLQVPGTLGSISVGSGGGVWGINGSGEVYSFSTP